MAKEQFNELIDKLNSLFVNKEYYFSVKYYNKEGRCRHGEGFYFKPTNWIYSNIIDDPKNLDDKKIIILMRDEKGFTTRPITISEKSNPVVYSYNSGAYKCDLFIHSDEGRCEFFISTPIDLNKTL